jgi:hypothetical protein
VWLRCAATPPCYSPTQKYRCHMKTTVSQLSIACQVIKAGEMAPRASQRRTLVCWQLGHCIGSARCCNMETQHLNSPSVLELSSLINTSDIKLSATQPRRSRKRGGKHNTVRGAGMAFEYYMYDESTLTSFLEPPSTMVPRSHLSDLVAPGINQCHF